MCSSNGVQMVKATTGLQNTHDQFLNLPQTFCFALGMLVQSLMCQLGRITLVCSPHKVFGMYQFPAQILPNFRYLTTALYLGSHMVNAERQTI